ncbi:MAG: DNA polymerase I [Alistipes sp.]|jgi:DNA polymerase-1|nr:DNA polymerase I [Alistipes sp.]
MNKLFLLDAYALIFRAYYAFMGQQMRNGAGLVTSPIYGFTRFLREIIIRERPRHLGVAFDPRGGNFRHQLYPLYKANRTETPEEIVAAVPWIKRILDAMCIPVLEVAGWEADDVIGTLSVKASKAGYQTFMVTPDKDFGQLVSDRAVIYKQRKNSDEVEIVDREAIRARYGVDDPRLVIDILALWGDASDNVPGVPGIGEKGAAKLVSRLGTVENILAAAESGSADLTGRVRENLLATRDQLLLSKRLVTIDVDAPVEFTPETLEMCDPDCDALKAIYNELGFRSFLREMESDVRSPFNSARICLEGSSVGLRSEFSEPLPPPAEVQSPRPEGSRQSAPTPHGGGLRFAAQPDLFSPPEDIPTQPDLFSSPASGLDTIDTVAHEYTTIENDDELRKLVATLSTKTEFAYDTETTGYDCFTNRVVGVSLCAEPHKAFWVPLPPETRAAGIAILKPLFENEKIAKIGQNIKFDDQFMLSAGVEVRGRKFDTMLAHYLLDPESRHGMNYLAATYLGYDPIPISALIGSGVRAITMDMVPPDRVATYAAEDADVTLRLHRALWPKVVEQPALEKLYLDIEEPLIDVLAAMEREGVRIDTQALAEYATELTTGLADLETRIRELTGEPALNINSAQQLGQVLFAKMRLGGEKPKMTKTRQYRTDEETLQGLAGKHEVVGLILEYRGTKKLLSTYVEALPQLVNPVTGRIHTSYNQAVTATGRLSSTNPNLQNIPIRDEQGRAIRRAFVPSESDRVLLSADYSQVELRLMAHLSGDAALIEAFRAGEDIHRATAARIFGVAPSAVTPEQRRRAKTANFGIIYGISAFGLSQRLGIPRGEASDIIAGYFRSYPGVRAYMERVVEEARARGYVETIFGRRRYLEGIGSGNATVRGLAERNAVNAPIQGSAADVMKIAMIRIFNGLRERKLRSRMILQVHDEVVVDTLASEKDEVAALVREAMQGAASLSVDLLVEVGTGPNWLDAH